MHGRPVDIMTGPKLSSVILCDWAWIELTISYGRSERMHCLHGRGIKLTHSLLQTAFEK